MKWMTFQATYPLVSGCHLEGEVGTLRSILGEGVEVLHHCPDGRSSDCRRPGEAFHLVMQLKEHGVGEPSYHLESPLSSTGFKRGCRDAPDQGYY
jgi:hypothetical protein